MAKLIVKDTNGTLYNIAAIQGKGVGKSAYTQAVEAGFLGSEEEFIAKLNQKASLPIGAIYMTTSTISPSETFGGSWKQITDRFIYGTGAYELDSVGGEAEHVLTIAEMPSHTHTFACASANASSFSGYSTWYINSLAYYAYATHSTGEDVAHENMPPYLAVNIYQRVG